MAQRTKRVGLERSYQPIDPNTMPETLHATDSEDAPEQRIPVIPYEGYNFMPTAYGYRSYFGTNAAIEGDPMLNHDNTREIFCVQLGDLSNLIVALCDEGIYTRSGDISDSFVQQIALVAPADETLLEWSYCIIENILYVYRQAEDHVWTLDLTAISPAWTENTPTTLNMAGQLGIFKAGGRLGFWDSDNSVGYSSFEDKFNVTPAISTGANITKFVDVIGSIINIVQHGDGFIIYATKSIVGVFKDSANTFLWKAVVISNKAGIAYRKQCVISEPDSLHYAWTSIGLMKIDKLQAELVGTEVYDFLKESQLPVYLKFLEGRYLFIQLPDADYVDGIITFFTHTVEESSFTLSRVAETVDQLPDRLITVNYPSDELSADTFRAYDLFPDHAVVVEDKGSCANPRRRCTGVDYGHYRDHFWYPSNPGTNLDPLIGDLTTLVWSLYPMTINSRVYNAGATENPLLITQQPSSQLKGFGSSGILEADFHTLDNEQNFFSKSFALGEAYKRYLAAYLNELYTTRLPFQLGDTVINQAEDTTSYQIPVSTQGLGFDATWLSGVKKSPSTTPLNDPVNPHFAFAYLDDFWYEFGRSGELFYFLMRPREVNNVSFLITNSYSNIKYPVTVNLSSPAGGTPLTLTQLANDIDQYNLGADPTDEVPTLDVATGNIVCPDLATLRRLLNDVLIADDMLNHLIGSGWTLTPSGAPTYKYVNLAGVQSSGSLAGLSASYDATPVAAIGDQLRFHLNGAAGEEFTIKLFAAGLESADNIRRTLLTTPVTPCTFYVHFNYSYPYEYLRYDANGNPSVSATPVPAMTFAQVKAAVEANSACAIPGGGGNPSDDPTEGSRLMGVGMTVEPDTFLTEFTYTLEGYEFTYPGSELVFTFPGSTFLMQRGTAAPFDIVWQGSYVYDTGYKKWGKQKGEFRQLLDFSPVNSTAIGTIPYTQFGVKAAILDNDGYIRMFDMHPDDSVIKYGKMGLYRGGMTSLEMIKADFRQNCTGQLQLETSLDGRTVETGLTKTRDYEDVAQVVEGFNQSGKWHNLIFRGQFDLSYLEFVGWPHTRR